MYFFVIDMIKYLTLNCNSKLISLEKPAVMGIINVTPDSFYAGSRLNQETTVLERIEGMIADGASLVDVGAMSSRPGAEILPATEEWSRLSALIPSVRHHFPDLLLSIDTIHSSTAEKALDLGADMINDISGGTFDPVMMKVVGRFDVPFVIMHMKGMPRDMQDNPVYENVVTEVFDFFVSRIAEAEENGIVDLLLDPGFGFGKTLQHNYELLHHLNAFDILRYPVLAGISRKGMIHRLLHVDPENALNGTTAVHMLALMKGVRVLRAHDVKEAIECIKIWEKFNNPEIDTSRLSPLVIG